jgi:hypothetical protein
VKCHRHPLPTLLGILLVAVLSVREVKRREVVYGEWAALRFRDPQATETQAAELADEAKKFRQARQAVGFQADVSEAVRDEMEVWKNQFHLGDQDRAERLALQQLTEADMRARIREALLDQAWLEQQKPLIPPQAALDWYEAHREELRIPLLHRVSHLFLTTHDPKKPDRQAELQAITRQLQAGVPFAELAKLFSEDERSRPLGGALGWISPARVPADFMAAITAQPVGRVSQPVRTRLGWHFLLVHERLPSRLPSFEEVRPEIEAMLEARARQAMPSAALASPAARQ